MTIEGAERLKTELKRLKTVERQAIHGEGRVVFGATVELEDSDAGERVSYQIVGDDEADIKQGKISVSSPIPRALIGKSEGDIAEVDAPGGTRVYEILGVRYA